MEFCKSPLFSLTENTAATLNQHYSADAFVIIVVPAHECHMYRNHLACVGWLVKLEAVGLMELYQCPSKTLMRAILEGNVFTAESSFDIAMHHVPGTTRQILESPLRW